MPLNCRDNRYEYAAGSHRGEVVGRVEMLLVRAAVIQWSFWLSSSTSGLRELAHLPAQ